MEPEDPTTTSMKTPIDTADADGYFPDVVISLQQLTQVWVVCVLVVCAIGCVNYLKNR